MINNDENLYDKILKYEWKDIPGYEGEYKINKEGFVLAINKNSISLRDRLFSVNVCKNGIKKRLSTIQIMKELFDWEDIPFRLKDKNFDDIEGELWSPVKDWEEWYSISNLGRLKCHYNNIRTTKQEKLIKPKINSSGYHAYALCINGRRKDILFHRLVAQAFIPNPNNLPVVNHIDGDKTNNKVENLEWCTHAENMAHAALNNLTYKLHEHDRLHTLSKMDEEKVRKARDMYYIDKMAQEDIADHFNVTKSNISAIITWRTWFYVDPEKKEYYKSIKSTKHKRK